MATEREVLVRPAWRPGRAARPPLLLPGLVAVLLLAFLLAPWSLQAKAHAALHGLCAQRPSHSFRLGGQRLPFDARMTGIYGGFLAAAVYLVARGRHRRFGLPGWPILLALGGFVLALAIDGTNSLLLDLGLWHPYPPDNRLRLATGLLTGIALAAALCFVVSTTLWRTGRVDERVVEGWGDLGRLVAIQAPFAAAVLSGAGWLYGPVTLWLLAGAIGAVGSLVLAALVLIRRQENRFRTGREVEGSAALALVLALVIMVAIAAGRFALERWTGAPPLT